LDIAAPNSDEYVKTGFTVRPFALECLKTANKYFEVAVFTAGFDWYANPILDYLDPHKQLIQHRYFRQHCTYLEEEEMYIKDLRVFSGISLDQMLIADNFVYSFAFHLDNGIPIVPFYGDKADNEMIKLIKYIKSIGEKPNLRKTNGKIFKLKNIYDTPIDRFIDYYDFEVLESESSSSGSESENDL
jgi:CTD small phosphatase-like protein 2